VERLDAPRLDRVTWKSLRRTFSGTTRYQLLRQLGEGSFGAVFDVLDRERGTHVALKLLTRADASTLYRFKGEFRAFADVQHPNLVQLYELASEGDDWFFTMELVAGVDWLTFVRERALPPRNDAERETLDGPADLAKMRTEDAGPRCNIDKLYASALQLAGAVQALHRAGIVHRDVKPSNVLVDGAQRVVLVDFGLARPIAARVTGAGVDAVGTPAYMAPEQAGSAEITEAADWYAVGVMLFEALTGRLPFDGQPLEIITDKQAREAPRVSDFVASAHPELEALCGALLARDPHARPRGDLVTEILGAYRPSPRAAKSVRPPRADRSPLIGRRRALEELEAAFGRAQEGVTTTALVRGQSGIGKSALVHAFVEEVVEPRRGFVLAGRCYEREAVSYKAFDSAIDALSRVLVGLPVEQVAAVLPHDAAALARVFPVLDRVPTIAQAPRRALGAIDAQRLRTRAFAALRELLTRLGDRHPLVLFLDDFQWADDESVALLRDLTRGYPSPSMLVVITFRDEDVGRSAPLDALLASVSEAETSGRGAEICKIKLEPLSAEDSRELAATALGRPKGDPSVAAIASESGGSPFFLGELVQFALTGGVDGGAPKTIRLAQVLEERFARLGASERRLLEVFAIAGTPLERRVACQAAQIDLLQVEPIFRTLHRGKMVRSVGSERGDLVECFHNRIREAVVAQLSDSERRAHHLRLAAALQTLREADPEALYLHYEAAGVSERAAEYALVSAERAAAALAFDHAARLYAGALKLLPKEASDRNAIMVRMAEALMRAGRGIDSADAFLGAIDTAEPRDVLAHRHRAAEQLLFCGQLDRGLRIMAQICEQVGVAIPRSRAHAIFQLVLFMLLLRLRGGRFRARDPATVTAAELTRADVCWSMAGGLSLVDQVIARPFSVRAVLSSQDSGDPARLIRALVTEAGFRSSEGPGRKRRATALFSFARSLLGSAALPAERAFIRGVEGWARYFWGEWRESKAEIEDSLAVMVAGGTGSIWERDTLIVYSLMVRIYLGELAELARSTEQRLFDARDRGDLFAETIFVASRVNVRWLLDDAPDLKRRQVDEALRRWGQPGRFQIQHWYSLQSLAQVDLYAGEPLNALRRLEEAWPLLRRSFLLRVQNLRVEAISMRAFAAVGVAGQGTDVEAMLTLAEKLAGSLARERSPWVDAIALTVRAGVARVRRRDGAAVTAFAEAARLFEAQGMVLHAAASKVSRASLVGGDEGRALRAEVQPYFDAQTVKDPQRASSVFVPG
jgi:eukaryotic-like serine/threonine-protein kinase